MFSIQRFKMPLVVALGVICSVIAIEFPRFFAFLPGLLALVGLSFLSMREKEFPKISVAHVTVFVVIAALSFLSFVWSVDPNVSLKRAIKMAPLLFAGLIIFTLALNAKTSAFSGYIKMIAVMLLCGASLVVFELSFNDQIYSFLRGISSVSSVADAVYNRGTVIIILSVFLVIGYYGVYMKNYAVSLALLLPVIAMLLLTDSQSAQLAFVLGGLCFFCFPYKSSLFWYVLLVVIVALTIFAPFIAPLFYKHAEFINSMPFFGGNMGYAGPRLEIWDYVARYIQENLIYGYGIEATRVIKDFDSAEVFIEGNTILHPHNFALQVWVEFGAIGAFLCCALVSYIVLSIYRLNNVLAQRVALSTFMAVLSISSTGYGIWQGWWLGALCFTAGNMIYFCRFCSSNPPKSNEQKSQ